MNIWLFALALISIWSLVKLAKFMVIGFKDDATNADDSCREEFRIKESTMSSGVSISQWPTTSSGTTSSYAFTTYGGGILIGGQEESSPECPAWAEVGEIVIDEETGNEWIVTCEYVCELTNTIILQVEHIETEGLEREFILSAVIPAEGDLPI